MGICWILVLIFILLTIALVYVKLVRPLKHIHSRFRDQNVPCESFVPLIGQLLSIYRAVKKDQIIDLFADFISKNGYFYFACFGHSANFVLLEPDMISDVFSRFHASDYVKPVNMIRTLEPLFGLNNLLLSEGYEHDRARKMINPAFYLNNLKQLISMIVLETRRTFDEIVPNTSEGKTIDLQKEFIALTLSVIASSAFGQNLESIPETKRIICETIAEVLSAIEYRSMRMINQISILSKLPICQKHIVDQGSKKIGELVNQIILDRRRGRTESSSANKDLLDLLLLSVDDQGSSFNDQEIKDQSLTFFIAGHETTANLTIWLLFILMTHDDILKDCREEVDRILPGGLEPTDEHLSQLHICEAVIQEGLRLYPPAPLLVRECVHENQIGSESKRQITIPIGTTVMIDVYHLHRRADLWSEPSVFNYRRWLRDPVTGLKPKLPHPYAYLPFGAGPRSCIGQNFALLEVKIILVTLLQRFELKLEPGQKLVPDLFMSMRPKHGMKAAISRRK